MSVTHIALSGMHINWLYSIRDAIVTLLQGESYMPKYLKERSPTNVVNVTAIFSYVSSLIDLIIE